MRCLKIDQPFDELQTYRKKRGLRTNRGAIVISALEFCRARIFGFANTEHGVFGKKMLVEKPPENMTFELRSRC